MANRRKITVDQLTQALSRADERFIDESELAAELADCKNHISDYDNPHAVTAAQVGAAAASHKHSTADMTSGTLPVSRGGTGNTSVDSTPTSGSTKMVTSGGVYTALTGKSDTSHTHGTSAAFTLAAASWTSGSGVTAWPYKYALSVSGITVDSVVEAVLDPASADAATELCSACESGAGTVTFYARTAPTSVLSGTLYIR